MKKASKKNYESICRELGFIPDVHFVEITNRGTITFTAGKPQEVKALLQAVRNCGYIPAKSLIKAARY
jgi:hypothetical protein